MGDLMSQIAVFVFGVGAVLVVGMRRPSIRRWGYVLGLCSQPFWYYTFIAHEQYILVLCAIAYTVSWAVGFRNYWLLKESPNGN